MKITFTVRVLRSRPSGLRRWAGVAVWTYRLTALMVKVATLVLLFG